MYCAVEVDMETARLFELTLSINRKVQIANNSNSEKMTLLWVSMTRNIFKKLHKNDAETELKTYILVNH